MELRTLPCESVEEAVNVGFGLTETIEVVLPHLT